MIRKTEFDYQPADSEAEKASNSYLMSLIAVLVGLPMPIINLVATLIFYFGNRRQSYFVRWHCTQALLSQVSLLIMNSVAFWWTINIIIGTKIITNWYLAYIFTVFLYNLTEFIATIYTAIQTRKGHHIEWWFYGTLTNETCDPRHE